MQYLLDEDEYKEYQQLKNGDAEVVESEHENQVFFHKIITACKFTVYKKAEEMGRQYVTFEVPADIIPDDIQRALNLRT